MQVGRKPSPGPKSATRIAVSMPDHSKTEIEGMAGTCEPRALLVVYLAASAAAVSNMPAYASLDLQRTTAPG